MSQILCLLFPLWVCDGSRALQVAKFWPKLLVLMPLSSRPSTLLVLNIWKILLALHRAPTTEKICWLLGTFGKSSGQFFWLNHLIYIVSDQTLACEIVAATGFTPRFVGPIRYARNLEVIFFFLVFNRRYSWFLYLFWSKGHGRVVDTFGCSSCWRD